MSLMKKSAVLLLLVALGVSAQTEPTGTLRVVPYVSPDTPQGWGPFPAIMIQEEGLSTHTVYRPTDLDALGDEDAAKMFEGPECGLCRDPRWHVSKKNME